MNKCIHGDGIYFHCDACNICMEALIDQTNITACISFASLLMREKKLTETPQPIQAPFGGGIVCPT